MRFVTCFSGCFGVLALLAATTVVRAEDGKPDGQKIEQLTGAKGQMNEKENVFKVSMPRSDLNVTAGGVKLTPALGLTCWAAFTRAGGHTMVMCDQVLLEDQVNPVMSVALENGLEVTALHNHFAADSPRVMFMHIGGSGDEAALATAVGKVFSTTKQTAGGRPAYPSLFDKAAVVFRSLILNHPFVDGNKRMAVASANVNPA